MITVEDNFGQQLENYDIVAVATNLSGSTINTLGIYYNTCVFTLSDLEDSRNCQVQVKRLNMFNNDRYGALINRQEVEYGMASGDFKMKSLIKINEPNEYMKMFKETVFDKFKKGEFSQGISRKYINSILADIEKIENTSREQYYEYEEQNRTSRRKQREEVKWRYKEGYTE